MIGSLQTYHDLVVTDCYIAMETRMISHSVFREAFLSFPLKQIGETGHLSANTPQSDVMVRTHMPSKFPNKHVSNAYDVSWNGMEVLQHVPFQVISLVCCVEDF